MSSEQWTKAGLFFGACITVAGLIWSASSQLDDAHHVAAEVADLQVQIEQNRAADARGLTDQLSDLKAQISNARLQEDTDSRRLNDTINQVQIRLERMDAALGFLGQKASRR